jgi:hypothetical protein
MSDKSKRSVTAQKIALKIAGRCESDEELLDIALVLLELHAERIRRR